LYQIKQETDAAIDWLNRAINHGKDWESGNVPLSLSGTPFSNGPIVEINKERKKERKKEIRNSSPLEGRKESKRSCNSNNNNNNNIYNIIKTFGGKKNRKETNRPSRFNADPENFNHFKRILQGKKNDAMEESSPTSSDPG